MTKWIPSWHSVPINFHQGIGTLHNTVQRSTHVNNLNGSKIRLRFNNRYSPDEMHIEHVSAATRNRITGKLSAPVDVLLNGNRKIVLAPDADPYSDETALAVTADDDIAVTLYFSEETVIRSVCLTYAKETWQPFHYTGSDDDPDNLVLISEAKAAPGLGSDQNPNAFAAGISEIAVLCEDDTKLIAIFGDSITHMSYYADPLTLALYKKFPGKCAVVNGGISGNQISRDHMKVPIPGGGARFGSAGRDRIEKDLYDGLCPDIAFILEGANDTSASMIAGKPSPTAAEIYEALCSAVSTAKKHGSTVYVSTVMPVGYFNMPWKAPSEEIRVEYNRLIREGGSWDDMIDLDMIMRDPDDPGRIQEGMHLGDYLHPGPLGGKKMAEAIFNKWFK